MDSPECLFYKTKSGCRFGEKCSFAHRQVDEQPTKRSKSNNDKSAVAMLKKGNWEERESVSDACHDRTEKPVKRSDKKLGQNSSKRQFSDARQLGCVFQDMKPPKSILRKSPDMPKTIQRVKFKKAIARHTKIRDQNPSLGYICPGEPHERSPNAPKFEDRSQEETEWQEQGAREAASVTIKISVQKSKVFCAAECEKCIGNQESQRQKPKWENGSTAVQGLPQRNLRHSILWKMASSRVLVLQDQEWLCATIEEPIHTSTAEKSERPERDQDLRCQSGPSAKNSVLFSGGDSSKNYGADQQRLQISDLHFDKFPTPATFLCWKIRFKTEVCTCSQFPTEAMQWIKEAELVDSVDELRSSSSTRGISMPNFEVLDARIASALNKITQNTRFKKNFNLEEMKAHKEDRFLQKRQIAYLIYEYFQVTGANDSSENYADTCSCSSKWWYSGFFLIDDANPIWWHLGKFVLELYDLETHQKKLGPDYHRLKAMVKRSIEQEIRNKNFGARNGNYERNAVVKNQGTKQREQRSLGFCWRWKANGQCSKGGNCSFRHDVNKRAKKKKTHTQPNPSPSSSTQQNVKNASGTKSPRGRSPSGKMARLPCKDYLKGTCATPFFEKWHPPECLFYKSENGCKLGDKCSYAHRRVDEQPCKKSETNGDKSAVAILKNTRHLGCVFQDMKPPKSTTIWRKISNRLKPIRCVRFTKAVLRHANIRDQNPSLGRICPGDPHQRSPNAPKIEDRSQEETEWQERYAREAALKLFKRVLKLKEHERATFFSLSENRCLPASTLKLEEREFVVDSGASMHMISKKGF